MNTLEAAAFNFTQNFQDPTLMAPMLLPPLKSL